MKISIIVGVIQMCVGIILSLLNHLEYKDYKKVLFQFIPEFVFFNVILAHTPDISHAASTAELFASGGC